MSHSRRTVAGRYEPDTDVRQAWLESSVRCTSGPDQNRSERPSGDRPAGVRPGRWSTATRPSPKATAERSAARPSCADRRRVRACAQRSDRWSTSERHDFPWSDVKRGAGFGADGQSVHLDGGPRKYREPHNSAADTGAGHQCRPAAIHATLAATRLDPNAIQWERGVAWLQAGSREQAAYTSREDPHSDASSSVE